MASLHSLPNLWQCFGTWASESGLAVMECRWRRVAAARSHVLRPRTTPAAARDAREATRALPTIMSTSWEFFTKSLKPISKKKLRNRSSSHNMRHTISSYLLNHAQLSTCTSHVTGDKALFSHLFEHNNLGKFTSKRVMPIKFKCSHELTAKCLYSERIRRAGAPREK